MTEIIVTTREELNACIENAIRNILPTALQGLQNKEDKSPMLPTTKAASEFLATLGYKISESTINNKIGTGEIPSHKMGGRRVFYKEELIEWVEQPRKKVISSDAIAKSAKRKLA